jgi:hypothetical protein
MVIIGLFDDMNDAQNAYDALLDDGLRPHDISVVAHADIPVAKGTRMPEFPRAKSAAGGEAVGAAHPYHLCGIGKTFVAGPLSTWLSDGARDSLLRALMDLDLHEDQAGLYSEGVRRGGALLIVHDAEAAERASRILPQHNVVDTDERMQRWRRTGWNSFDETLSPLTTVELQRERELARRRLEQRPGETFPKGGAGGGVWSGKAPHTDDEKRIEEHARAEWLETAHPDLIGPEAGPPHFGDRSPFDDQFRNHYRILYGDKAGVFEEYKPAYEYGAMLGASDRYTDRDWSEVAVDAQRHWEETHPQTWERYRDAVRYGWGRARGQRYNGPERRGGPRNEFEYRW